MPFSVLCRFTFSRASLLAVFAGLTTAAALILLAVPPDSGSHTALFGLVVAAFVTLGSIGVAASVMDTDITACRAVSGERRLRGAFRRQRRPDEPGRPLPRAPGSVL
ncbi:DUF6412 domain-containing protein [Rhodococcoides yunnanense]|uniref:DUF6412 domain-containing protein n=1 Tax=Rhodococcoides yunnanense TaxID=278209 RepID=UPI001115014F|nr:DUF6412 domain-containing protein [Rhodococcus yunnanensis]